jgi:hypothetical protein
MLNDDLTVANHGRLTLQRIEVTAHCLPILQTLREKVLMPVSRFIALTAERFGARTAGARPLWIFAAGSPRAPPKLR